MIKLKTLLTLTAALRWKRKAQYGMVSRKMRKNNEKGEVLHVLNQ